MKCQLMPWRLAGVIGSILLGLAAQNGLAQNRAEKAPVSRKVALPPHNIAALSPDGATLYLGGEGEVVVHRLNDGAILRRLRLPTKTISRSDNGKPISESVAVSVGLLAASPKGDWLLAGSGREQVFVIQLKTGKVVRLIGDENALIVQAAWHSDNQRVALAHSDGQVTIWRAVDGERPIVRLPATEKHMATGLAWLPDGRLAFSDRLAGLRLWQEGGGTPKLIRRDPATSGNLAISGQQLVAIGDLPHAVTILRLPALDQERRYLHTDAKVSGLFAKAALSPNGRWLAAVNAIGDTVLWDRQKSTSQVLYRTPTPQKSRLTFLGFTTGNGLILGHSESGLGSGAMISWDLEPI